MRQRAKFHINVIIHSLLRLQLSRDDIPINPHNFLPLLSCQQHSYSRFVCVLNRLYSLFFLSILFFNQRGMLRISLHHPILFSKAEG